MSRRLTAREKLLSWLVGGTVGVLLNVVVLQYFFTTYGKLKTDLARKKALLTSTQRLLSDSALWQQRDAWLTEHQPRLENEATAGVQLLAQVQDLAKKFAVTPEQPSIGTPERQPRYTSVTVTLDTKSSWKALHELLQALQGPEQFIVVESARLNIDPGDQTQMRGHLRVAKWFAEK